LPTEEPNFLAHAFKSQYNLIGLGTALGFAVLSGTLLPIVVAAGVELIVLPLVSGNPRFQRLIRARVSQEEDQEAAQRTEKEAWEMLRDLPNPEQQRYRALQGLASEIRQNYKALDSSSQMLVEELVRKLDFLLSFYLRMRYSLMRYQAYFSTTDPERIQERIAMLEHEMATGPERIQQIKARTRVVLEKRLERYQKALENRQLVEAQTETVEEVLQLLRDQSYSMRDPRTITQQLDGLVSSAEDTERGVRDLEELMSIETDALLPAGDDLEAEPEAARPPSARAAEPPPIPRLREVPPPAASAPPRKKISQ
jgi:hypothetical protein